jgi:4-alpha-glucanotransferase
VAVFALAPLQDFMNLGTEARMNFPGKVGGFWSWRMPEGSLTDDLKWRIRELNYLSQR